ncbi:MAG: Gfo/Idh/MocA family oxidoreductase, partial [Nitrososphaerota archaeon]|nr:Gfo/Idh/MocA family oxidoreductase [Nitrososphaerota archaeon]
MPVIVVGAGKVASRMHLPAWVKIPEVEVVAVCDLNRERAYAVAKEWRIGKVYTDFNEVLEEHENGN